MQVFCPKCKAEYREGFTVCADCGVPLVETLPASPVLEPVFFFAAEGEAAGELSALLYRAGIRCYLKGDDGIFIRLDPELAVPGELYVDRRDLPMAKQCLRLLSGPPVPVDEEELLEAVNALDIGPQGFGGVTTALAVHIETAPTHIACLPCAVNINCHVSRHMSEVI